MKARTGALLLLGLMLALLGARGTRGAPLAAQPLLPTAVNPAATAPLRFEETAGQAEAAPRFVARGAQGTLTLATDALWLTLFQAASTPQAAEGVHLKLSFVGANPRPALEPFHRLPTRVSYFLGNDPAQWRADVPVWGGVRYRDLYPGVDLEVEGAGGAFAWRMVARDGTSLDMVRLRVEGATGLALAGAALRLDTAVGSVALPLLEPSRGEPSAMQPRVVGDTVALPFAQPPQPEQHAGAQAPDELRYASLLGDDALDMGHDLVVDEAGATYIVSIAPPAAEPPQRPGRFEAAGGNNADVRVVKLNSDGSGLDYVTTIGGNGQECIEVQCTIALSVSGAVHIVGETDSPTFPVTDGAFDRRCGSDGSCNGEGGTRFPDSFALKLSASGTALVYSTYLGGSGADRASDAVLDDGGSLFITGDTESADFPTSPGAWDRELSLRDAFVLRLNPNGTLPTYATFLGGFADETGGGIAVDSEGVAVVVGATTSVDFPTTDDALSDGCNIAGGSCADAFVARVGTLGASLLYGSYLGGQGDDAARAVAERNGTVWVAGATFSADFPVTGGAADSRLGDAACSRAPLVPCGDGFVARLNFLSAQLDFATFVGGGDDDEARDIVLDGDGAAHVVGVTFSSDFPVTPGAADGTFGGGTCGTPGNIPCGDAFLMKLSRGGAAREYATFLGGSRADEGNGLTVDGSGLVYLAGATFSNDFPTTADAFDNTFNQTVCGGSPCGDAFVAKVAPPARAATARIEPGGGALVSALDGTSYTFASGTFTETAQVAHTPLYPGDGPVEPELRGIGHAFETTAISEATGQTVPPLQPYTLQIQYTDAELGLVSESSLGLYGWDGSQWVLEPSATVNAGANTLTATPSRFGLWQVLGRQYVQYLPLVFR